MRLLRTPHDDRTSREFIGGDGLRGPRARAVLALVIATLSGAVPPLQCAHPLLELDVRGAVVQGSEARVLDVVRSGGQLRIGWYRADRSGAPTVTHWVDATFVTARGPHVYAQFGAIHAQRPTRAPVGLDLHAKRGRWFGLIGTDGMLEGRRDDDPVRTNRVPMMWCESPQTFRDRCASDWRVVYRNDAQGRRVAGTRSRLVDAVTAGRPLRLGWGAKRKDVAWAHSAEPDFVTLTQESEVVAQLPEHLGQRSYHRADEARFSDDARLWRGLLSTTGTFDAAWIDRGTGKITRRLPQRAWVTWMAWMPPEGCMVEAIEPRVEGGVTRAR